MAFGTLIKSTQERKVNNMSSGEKKKGKNGKAVKWFVIGVIAFIVVGAIALESDKSQNGQQDQQSLKSELSEYVNYSEEELIKALNVEKNDMGMYPNADQINFTCIDGKVGAIMINQRHKNDDKYTLFGIALGDNEANVDDKLSSQFEYLDSTSSDGGKQKLYKNIKTGYGLQIDYDSDSTVTGIGYALESE